MLVDLLIILGCVFALYRGSQIGFLRQACSTAGFFVGMLVGAWWIEPHVVGLAHGADARAILTVTAVLGSALLFMTAGEYMGIRLKYGALPKRLYKLDNGAGSVISAVSLLIGIWLLASILSTSSVTGLQAYVRDSRIIGQLDRLLPPAPTLMSKLGHLIDPNGFPDVFIGDEPVPRTPVNLPALGELASAVNSTRDSVVRIKGQGCGGIVSGSGFVVRSDLVATNAHVVAGIRHPVVQDGQGSHTASVIWFDPNLDFAILQVRGLDEHSLALVDLSVRRDTPGAVLGYPGGGDFSAKPAVVLDEIAAAGRNIYGTGHTVRDVYELHADVVPGNSGGPLVSKDGKVIGIIFAESTTYDHVGYALTTKHLDRTIDQAESADRTVGTGACAE